MSRSVFTTTELKILKLWKRLTVAMEERSERTGKFGAFDTQDEPIHWTQADRLVVMGHNPINEVGLVMRLEVTTLEVEVSEFSEHQDPNNIMIWGVSKKMTMRCLRHAIKMARD